MGQHSAANSGLEQLARDRFADLPLTTAELALLRAAIIGELAVCSSNLRLDDPANNPSNAEKWDADRSIRAELIRWLCVYKEAAQIVDPRGLQIFGAVIPDVLNLSFAAVPFPIMLAHCR